MKGLMVNVMFYIEYSILVICQGLSEKDFDMF